MQTMQTNNLGLVPMNEMEMESVDGGMTIGGVTITINWPGVIRDVEIAIEKIRQFFER